MNTNNANTTQSNFNDVFIYLPEIRVIMRIAEGTGDNLLPEDTKEGYVDYIYYTIHELDMDFPEYDGGMMLTTELVREKYVSLTEAVPDVLGFHYDNRNMSYALL